MINNQNSRSIYHNYNLTTNEDLTDQTKHKDSGLWFQTFLKYTNQKSATCATLQTIISKLINTDLFKITDIGCGEGELALRIIDNLRSFKIEYVGIDNDLELLSMFKNSIANRRETFNFVKGDCFNPLDMSKLPKDSDLTIVSNIAYYAKDVGTFVSSVLNTIHTSGIAIFIHEAPYSTPNMLRSKYKAKVEVNTASKISTFLSSNGIGFLSMEIQSKISMPENYKAHIRKFYEENFTSLIEDKDLADTKNLFEFVFQTPLELLKEKGQLSSALEDIKNIAENNNDSIPISSAVQLAYSFRAESIAI